MAASMVVDDLVARNIIRPPSLIKIDVDGNELMVLRGMRSLLSGKNKPRSVLVEINVGQDVAIDTYMRERGYGLSERNLDRPGEKKLRQGIPENKIEINAIYRAVGV
jgi:Methyltransferase FkbM domain